MLWGSSKNRKTTLVDLKKGRQNHRKFLKTRPLEKILDPPLKKTQYFSASQAHFCRKVTRAIFGPFWELLPKQFCFLSVRRTLKSVLALLENFSFGINSSKRVGRKMSATVVVLYILQIKVHNSIFIQIF